MGDGTARANAQPRQRILAAAQRLVSDGGYDAVQVQTVTDHANVSSRTVYRHFPSLDSLIITALTEPSDTIYRRFTRRPHGPDAKTRVDRLIADLTEAVTANRASTVALLRALLSGKSDVAEYVPRFANMLRTLFAYAIAPDGPTTRDRETARYLQSVWFSTIVVWATDPGADIHVADIMHEAARMLLPTGGNHPTPTLAPPHRHDHPPKAPRT